MDNGVYSSAATPAGASFEEAVLPHLGAARRLARWLMRNEHDAEDCVQDAALRALRYFGTFTGGSGRAWFLRIVRNSCRGCQGSRLPLTADPFDEQLHGVASPSTDPELLLKQTDTAAFVERALQRLPARFQQILMLREWEGFSYQELSGALDIPIGTVMSSLSRARQALRAALDDQLKQAGAVTGSTYEARDNRF
jgi:RNA polymerase sigma-70 factor, ECF subfamily